MLTEYNNWVRIENCCISLFKSVTITVMRSLIAEVLLISGTDGHQIDKSSKKLKRTLSTAQKWTVLNDYIDTKIASHVSSSNYTFEITGDHGKVMLNQEDFNGMLDLF